MSKVAAIFKDGSTKKIHLAGIGYPPSVVIPRDWPISIIPDPDEAFDPNSTIETVLLSRRIFLHATGCPLRPNYRETVYCEGGVTDEQVIKALFKECCAEIK